MNIPLVSSRLYICCCFLRPLFAEGEEGQGAKKGKQSFALSSENKGEETFPEGEAVKALYNVVSCL
jgi:hypothetical protein